MAFNIPFAEKTVTIGEVTFKFREPSVADNDFAAEAAKGPDGEIDGRQLMRLVITRSCVEPKITVEDIQSLPYSAYMKLAEVVNNFGEEDESVPPKND